MIIPTKNFAQTKPIQRLVRSAIMLLAVIILPVSMAETNQEQPAEKQSPSTKPQITLEEALKKLKLDGVKINLQEQCVDVDSLICLNHGALELIACSKNTKEHESIVAIEAKARDVHTALILIGAKAGNPAMQKPTNKERTRWRHLPPRGGPIDVSIVLKDKKDALVELPISKFIMPYTDDYYESLNTDTETADEKDEAKFPTNTFIFAGSILHGKENARRNYLADQSGNVISLATFGDELLCLPGVFSHAAGDFAWQVDDTHLPKLGTKVILRLRPKQVPTSPKNSPPLSED